MRGMTVLLSSAGSYNRHDELGAGEPSRRCWCRSRSPAGVTTSPHGRRTDRSSITRALDVEHDLSDRAAVRHVSQGRGGVGELERGADVRQDPPLGHQLQEVVFVTLQLLGLVLGEVTELEAQNVDALEQNEVQRDPGN